MQLPSPGKVVKWSAIGLLAAQAGVIIALTGIDTVRKRNRSVASFPSTPPVQLGVGDGTVTIYTKGRALFDAMLASIDSAQRSVYLETYIWKDDRVGQKFKDALIRAADRGVDVHVAMDWFGNLVVKQSFFTFPPNVHVFRHKPWSSMKGLGRLPGLNHRKLMVVDGKEGFIGGYNIGALYAAHWRDTHAKITGPAVAEMQNAFVDYWNGTAPGHDHLKSPAERVWESPIRITRNVPSVGVYPIRYSYMEAIDRAAHHIYLTHAYLIPDDDFTMALTEAADRGVDVRIIVPADSNHIVADWLSRGFYRHLLERGVRLFLYQKAMVHAKTATIDGVWSTIGTANLDSLSLLGNYEINAEITDTDVASEMEAIFAMDSGNCVELTLDEWQRRPLPVKISEWLLIPLRRLL